MSDFNVQNLLKENELKKISKMFDGGISDENWEEINQKFSNFTKLIRDNLIITKDRSCKFFYRNDMFFNVIKKALLNNPEKFKRLDILDEKSIKLNYEISDINNDVYDSNIAKVYEGFYLRKPNDLKNKKDFFSFSGILLLSLIQNKGVFPSFISNLSLSEIHDKVNSNEFVWISNLVKKEKLLENDLEDGENIEKFMKHFYEIAEIENICPFNLKNKIMDVMLYSNVSFLDSKDYFFNIMYDEHLIASLPKIKEENEELYTDLLNHLVYLLSIKNNSQGRCYIHNLSTLYEHNYRVELGHVEMFENLLERLPIKDLIDIKVRSLGFSLEGLSDWIPHLKGYEREKSLRETLEETKIVKEDTQQRKKI